MCTTLSYDMIKHLFSRECSLVDENKAVVTQRTKCTAAFSQCKKYEDEGLKGISACSSSTADLLAKAKALTANSAGLTAAKTTASSLANSTTSGGSRNTIKDCILSCTGKVRTGRSSRAAATTCAEVVTKISTILTLVEQNPASSLISSTASEVTSVTVTCSNTEKTSLTTQVASLATISTNQ